MRVFEVNSAGVARLVHHCKTAPCMFEAQPMQPPALPKKKTYTELQLILAVAFGLAIGIYCAVSE